MLILFLSTFSAASSDFTGVTSTVQFHPNKTVSSIKVAITEDRLCERREYFSLKISKLSSSAGNAASIGETNVTTVWILDDDGECRCPPFLYYSCGHLQTFLHALYAKGTIAYRCSRNPK